MSRQGPSRAYLQQIRLEAEAVDSMPPELRALVYEFGYTDVAVICNQGVEDPRDVLRILLAVRNQRRHGNHTGRAHESAHQTTPRS